MFANELEGLPILRVIVTHMHPDHIGLADWLCERWGVRLWCSATDYHTARLASQSTTGFGGERAARVFRFPWPDRPGRSGQDPPAHQLLPQPGALRARPYRRLMDGRRCA